MYEANRSETQAREVRELADAIFRRWQSYLLAIARRNAASKADAEEALGEALAAFLRAYDPDSGAPPLAWLATTIKRECWRKRRDAHLDRHVALDRGGGEEARPLLEALPSPAPETEARVIELEEARRRLRALKPDQRAALGLQAAGYSYREIAVAKGWTRTKTDRALRRGRSALREDGAAA